VVLVVSQSSHLRVSRRIGPAQQLDPTTRFLKIRATSTAKNLPCTLYCVLCCSLLRISRFLFAPPLLRWTRPSCMSANGFSRAARPLVAAGCCVRYPCSRLGVRQHQHQCFTTTTTRRSAAGGNANPSGAPPRMASAVGAAWSLPGVIGIAAAAGIAGWGLSELRHRGLPGTVLLDGVFPPQGQYASMREMQQVCCCFVKRCFAGPFKRRPEHGGGGSQSTSLTPPFFHFHTRSSLT
jgi:hypothetical protein